jgi:Raf kinase inhibitor-like YbhB/YbcL family protein
MGLQLTSRGFEHRDIIPDRYSREGGNTSPPLAWTDVPPAAKSLALIVDDPDASSGVFVHWLLYGLAPGTTKIEEGQSAAPALANGARQGLNGFGVLGYGGPQPPSGIHRYVFHLYALDIDVALPSGTSRQELDRTIQGHVLEKAQLMGLYRHPKRGSRAA